MYFDYFTAAALIDELNESIAGGRVQDILEIDELSLGLEVYHHQKRHYLYLSADPEHARAHLTDGKLRRGQPVPSPLGLLLNRYIEGGRILAVRQPLWERIIMLDMMTPDGEFTLIIEPIERRANIILLEGGLIRECARRVGPDENRVRQLLPGYAYQPPPPQIKLEPDMVTLDDIKRFLDHDIGAKVSQALTRGIYGLSPLLGREIAFQAAGRANIPAPDASPRAVFGAFQDVIGPLMERHWQPGYTVEDGEVTAFSVYPLTCREGWQPADSVSAVLEAYYGAVSGDRAYEASKTPVRKQLNAARKRLKGKLFSLKKQARDEGTVEFLRQAGELILAYQYSMSKGDTLLEAQYDPDGDPLKIKLDPLNTPVGNAQKYFAKYEKAKRARETLPGLIRSAEYELIYLDQLDADLGIAANWTDIGEVQEALQENGYWRGAKLRQTASGKSAPLKILTDDAVIWVGRNARQNEEVTFSRGAPEDIWLHARGVAGAHVIIKSGGRQIPHQIIEQAASLAAYYSKSRHDNKVEVMVTERRHVRKVKGGKPGLVRVLQETYPTLSVVPKAHEQ